MKRRSSDSTDLNDEIPPKKRRKIAQKAKNNCKYWRLENGDWNIFNLSLSTSLDRIGVVFSRNNSQYKVTVSDLRSTEIWSINGRISSPHKIAFNESLTVCIIAYECNKIDLYTIPNSSETRVQKQEISVSNDPNIAFLKILNDKIMLVTQRGMLYQRYFTEPNSMTSSRAQYALVQNSVNVKNVIVHCNGPQLLILVQRKTKKNEIFMFDPKQILDKQCEVAKSYIKHELKASETSTFEALIVDQCFRIMVLKSLDTLYCLQINKRNYKQAQNNGIAFQQNSDNSLNISIGVESNDSPNTFSYGCTLVFKEKLFSYLEIDSFCGNDVFVGHNQNQLIVWRMCNAGQSAKIILRSTSLFGEDICSIMGKFCKIPQKLVIRFIDRNQRQINIRAVDGKHGFIIFDRNDNTKQVSFLFRFDYNIILNAADSLSCLHHFTTRLNINI